jgi:hypothetical protein
LWQPLGDNLWSMQSTNQKYIIWFQRQCEYLLGLHSEKRKVLNDKIWKKWLENNLNPKNDAHETFVLVYIKNINALVQDLTTCSQANKQNMPQYVEWSFRNTSDTHEMTLPSPQRPYNLMLMMKRRHECWWKNKDLVTSSTKRCHQRWKVAHLNTFAKNIVINKISKEWKRFQFFSHNFERIYSMGLHNKDSCIGH